MRYHLHMPSYFLGTFTEYPFLAGKGVKEISRETGIPIRKVLHQIYCGEKEIKAYLKQL